MIQLCNVSKSYQGIGSKYPALFNINLEISQGENVFIIGKSGSGKSTLLNLITGIDRADQGQIIVNNQHLEKMTESQLAQWRGKNVGIVFQFHQLLPSLSAIDNILFAMELVNSIPKSERKKRAAELLQQVGLLEKSQKYPNELSGGEKQRVAIARALANDPILLVADEPTGNLDSQTSESIHDLFSSLYRSGKTILRVTHEKTEAFQFTSKFELVDGKLVSNK